MDLNENSESSDDFLENVTEDKSNSPADLISSASQEKTAVIGFHGFNDSNDRISECSRDDSFHSVETDNVTGDNRTVNGNSDESPVDNLNDDATVNEGLSVVNQSELSSNSICGEEHVDNSIKDDSESLLGSSELESRDDTGLEIVKSNSSFQEIANEDENGATDDFFDDKSKDSLTNTECGTADKFVSPDAPEKSCSNDEVAEIKSSSITRTDDVQTSIVDEADESFTLDEILEESECSDKDHTRVNSSNDENLSFDESSLIHTQAVNSESLIPENDESTSNGVHQSSESPSNTEADTLQVEFHPVCEEFVENSVTVEHVADDSEGKVENNFEENDVIHSEDTSRDFSPVSVPCPVSSSTDDIVQECEASLEKSKDDKSQDDENSSEVVTNEAETMDSFDVTNPIESSPSKNQPPDNFQDNQPLCSTVRLEEGDLLSAAEDSISHENSIEVPNENVPSSHGDSVPSVESTDPLPTESDIQNEKEVLRENDKTVELSENSEESSLRDELASDSTEDLQGNSRRRVSSRHKNNADGSESTLSDANDSSIMTMETRHRSNNLRSSPKSTSRSPSSRSNWQPKINDVKSAGNFSIRLKKFSEDIQSDPEIKEEVIDESYGMDSATKQKFHLVDFSIKLEKMEVDSDIEIISPPRTTRPAARKSLDKASSRSRRASAVLRNRMRSRTATNRSRPSTPTSSARRAAREPPSTRSSARSVSRVNGQVAKNAARRPTNNSRRKDVRSSKDSGRKNNDRGRSLRSAGSEADRDRIDFLGLFNLRSRQGNENVKGILVTPKNSRARSKRVSFRLPSDEDATTESSKGANSSSRSKEDSTSKSATKVSSSKDVDVTPRLQIKLPPLKYFGGDSSKSSATVPSRSSDRKRNASTKKLESIPAKRNRGSSRSSEDRESEEEEIDENPFEKLENLVDAARKTVDVWFECQCCNQKYYLIENAKQHVRTHFPNCLTN